MKSIRASLETGTVYTLHGEKSTFECICQFILTQFDYEY